MKSKIIQRLTGFLDHRSRNWQQRLCLIIFLTLSLTVIVAGVPMHIMGIVGRSSGIPYQGCGAANGSSTNATCLYLICVAHADAYRAGGVPIDYRWQDNLG